MSFFDDQLEAWIENDCQGSPDMYDPYSEEIFGAWVENPPKPQKPFRETKPPKKRERES